MIRFVVTGTGRSGTAHAAHLLGAAGLRCGHEDYFHSTLAFAESGPARTGFGRFRSPIGRTREQLRRRSLDLDGDASWLAVPRLASFEGTVLLQLRHPLAVVRSFMGTRFFSEPNRSPSQHAYAAAHFDVSGDDMLDSMRWWVEWNSRAAVAADRVYAVEALDVELLSELLTVLAVPSPSARAEAALSMVQPGQNSSASRGLAPGRIGWDDLPEGPAKSTLGEVARDWGYDPRDELSKPLPCRP